MTSAERNTFKLALAKSTLDSLRSFEKAAMDAASLHEKVLASCSLPAKKLEEQLRELERFGQSFDRKALALRMPSMPNMNLDVQMNPRVFEEIRSIKSVAQQQAENVRSGIVDHLRQLKEGLKEDEQLFVYFETENERIQVLQLSQPNDHTVILKGIDARGNSTSQVVSPTNFRITTKVMKVPQPTKARMGFTIPASS